MPDLEYTIEVSTAFGMATPNAEEMENIVHEALVRWYGDVEDALVDVDVTRVSDDL